jgi:hypothetical protein
VDSGDVVFDEVFRLPQRMNHADLADRLVIVLHAFNPR